MAWPRKKMADWTRSSAPPQLLLAPSRSPSEHFSPGTGSTKQRSPPEYVPQVNPAEGITLASRLLYAACPASGPRAHRNNTLPPPPQPVPEPEGDSASDMEEILEHQLHPHLSPIDKGKRSAISPAHSPTKPPPVKRQHVTETCSPPADLPTQSLAAFTTSKNSASEHSLKEMLLSLQAEMQRTFCAFINHLHSRIDFWEEHTEHIEQHLSTATTAHNTVVDLQYEHSEAIQQLCLKVAELEDRSRQTI